MINDVVFGLKEIRFLGDELLVGGKIKVATCDPC